MSPRRSIAFRAPMQAGIGFAVPVDTVSWTVPERIAPGRVIRPGIAATFASERWTKRLGVEGVLVLSVDAGSNASKVGLLPKRRDRFGDDYVGDIIVAVDETSIRLINDMLNAFEQRKIDDVVKVTIVRGQGCLTFDIQFEATN